MPTEQEALDLIDESIEVVETVLGVLGQPVVNFNTIKGGVKTNRAALVEAVSGLRRFEGEKPKAAKPSKDKGSK